MTQLQHLEDLHTHPACQNIKSLQEIIAEARHPSRFRRWEEIEAHLINDGLAPSLSAFLLYEYQFRKRSIRDLTEEINCSKYNLRYIMKKIGIPIKTISEAKTKVSEEDKKRIAEFIRKELEAHKQDPSKRLSSNSEIEELLGVAQACCYFDYLTEEEKDYRRRELFKQRGQYIKRNCLGIFGLSSEEKSRAAKEMHRRRKKEFKEKGIGIYGLTPKQLSEAGKKGGNKIKREKVGIHGMTREERQRIGRKSGLKTFRDGTGIFSLNEKERQRIRRKGAEGARKKKRYYVNGRFRTDSQQEGAVALLLEKYIPGYRIEEGQTFQANGDTPCLFDFILPQAIVEWHPINIGYDANKEDRQAYRELREEVRTPEERKALRELVHEFKEDLAVEYWIQRQEASDNSEVYRGREVILARTPEELYNEVIVRFGENYPSKQQFVREFRELKKRVKKTKQEVGLEQKAEAA